MECNKDEALRAKALAETKMLQKDFAAAKRMITKAQRLSSEVENISQMSTVCDVHCAAETKVNGEIDWYAVLQVPVFTNDDTLMKKQYRKLALLLHPDKNKFPGAEEAFKLVGEANTTLTDSSKRSVYDMKRRASVAATRPSPYQQARRTAPFEPVNLSNSARPETFRKLCSNCGMAIHYETLFNQPISCPRCTRPFNATRPSPYQQAGRAAPFEPVNLHQSSNDQAVPPVTNQQSAGVNIGAGAPSGTNQQSAGVNRGAGAPSGVNQQSAGVNRSAEAPQNFPGPQINVPGQQAQNDATQGVKKQSAGVNRSAEAPQNLPGPQINVPGQQAQNDATQGIKQQSAGVNRSAGVPSGVNQQIDVPGQQAQNDATQGVRANHGSRNATVNTKSGEDGNRASAAGEPKENTRFAWTSEGSSTSGLKRGRRSMVESSGSESISDSEEEIILDGAAANNAEPSEHSHRSSRQKQEVKYKEESDDEDVDDDSNDNNDNTVNPSNFKRLRKGGMFHSDDQSNETKLNEDKTGHNGSANGLNHEKIYDSVSSNGLDPNLDASDEGKFDCVDSEFFNFDQLRDVSQFTSNQIWAVYDSQGCMPRFYALITKVKMAPRFIVHFVWLEFDPTNRVEKLWSAAELPVACGHFKLGDSETAQETTMFSHPMTRVKRKTRNTFEIGPRKGDVWALFKRWDIGWWSDAGKREFEYDVVQVVSDFTTDTSIMVMPLVKIKGFVSLFMQPKEATPYVIPQDNRLRFSHLVPYRMMCGTEREGIPEGALELDPAALPLNFEKAFASVVPESSSVKFDCVDSEFFNFDQLRDVSQFTSNQIWAVYDSQGCMPRFYALITKVKMAPRFIVHFVWLEFDPTNRVEKLWSAAELPVACGHFKLGDSETAQETTMFSHPMTRVKRKTRNTFEIGPRKGDVWALFKRWDIGWWSDAGKREFEYDVVQVVSDFTTDTSIMVMPLVKIKGFVSLFMQPKEATPYVIPQDNRLRFSHLVPYRMMCGTEREGIPEGALELDPAALPLNFEKAFASVVPESSSVKGQEFDTKCVGSSSRNNSGKVSMRVGETAKEKNIEHSIPPAGAVTDDEEADDLARGEFECADSEFFEFTEIRLLHKFEPGQIWALYSDVDKFPNYYAIIKNVDRKNNIVKVRWLDVCPLGEEEKRLVKEDRTVGCGTFKVSIERDGDITCTGTESFSHLVLAARETGRRDEYGIIPHHCEIWAVYKNWRAGWTAQDFKNCEYELVKILAHTDESIQVELLRKVDGYTAVFRADGAVKTISKDEYPKFSHQIPSFGLTDEEGGKLRGYVELDPNSLPEAFVFT